MSRQTKVTCDGCGKEDIDYTGNQEDWYLTLAASRCQPWYVKEGKTGGVVTDVVEEPPLKHSLHFCSMHCFDKWWIRERRFALIEPGELHFAFGETEADALANIRRQTQGKEQNSTENLQTRPKLQTRG